MARKKWPQRESRHDFARRNVAYMEFMAGRELPNLRASIPPPPKKRAPRAARVGPSEHQEQVAVIQWWDASCQFYGLPHFALFAVPNGGARDAITGSRLKAEGVRRGALDLVLAKPTAKGAGLFIEMKVGDNRLSDYQKDFVAYLKSAGYDAQAHWSADSAIQAIKDYLA